MQNDFKQLVEWSLEEYSTLPWRQNRTLYTTLVSEIMLQQTTVGTDLPKYSEFLEAFPNLYSLANADEDSMRTAWKGLGYYRRAANLLKAAQQLVNQEYPKDEEKLQEINGIGPYTASALRSIGHDLPALAVDGNLKRVLSRYFEKFTPYEKGLDKEIRELLLQSDFYKLVEDLGPRKVNEALMDLGRVICRVKSPLCITCPLNGNCKAFKNGTQEELPVRTKKATKLEDLHLVIFINFIKKNELLLYKKIDKEWLTDQWEVPTGALKPPDKFKQYPSADIKIPEVTPLKTGITKYRIYNYAVQQDDAQVFQILPELVNRETSYFSLDDLPHISTATEKILKKQKIL
ncbi:MAG: hypothetical protein MK132_01375 [Lentisphaerales bacterium]|nr:hypothetical protein [Lentisphaerales bacterium]